MTNFIEKTEWKLGKWHFGRRWISYNKVEHSYGFLKKIYTMYELVL